MLSIEQLEVSRRDGIEHHPVVLLEIGRTGEMRQRRTLGIHQVVEQRPGHRSGEGAVLKA